MTYSSQTDKVNRTSEMLEFGNCRLDLKNRFLWCGSDHVSLTPKALDLLCVLVEGRGDVVTKQEIWEKVWNDSFVEETNLARNIYLLRKTLKELGQHEVIKTVPRRGYRFIGEVRESPRDEVLVESRSSTKTLTEIRDDLPQDARTDLVSRSRFAGGRRFSSGLVLSAAAFAIVLSAGIFLFSGFEKSGSRESVPEITSIAVLPLKSFSDDGGDEELRLRITDALITRLGGLPGLAVRPTSAVLAFAGNENEIIETGKRLKVDAVLDGRMQQEGDRLRVTFQLIRVATGEHVWSEQFDGMRDQILNLQDMITVKVSKSLGTDNREQPALARPLTDSPEAYEAYLKGRYFWYKLDDKSLRRSIEYFTTAAELDPGFSEAYSGLADAQHILFNYNFEATTELLDKAKENVKRALELKPNSADALITLGSIRMGYDWDWKGAEDALKLAIAADPNSATAHIRYGLLLIRIRRFDEAQARFERSLELDPLSTTGKMSLGMTLFCRKDVSSAETIFRNVLEIDDKVAGSHWLLSRVLWQMGRKDEALIELRRGLENDGNMPLANLVREEASNLGSEAAIRLLLHESHAGQPGTTSHNLAYLSTYVGDNENALHWLERSFDERHPWITWAAAFPEFETLASEPRYHAILNKMHLPY